MAHHPTKLQRSRSSFELKFILLVALVAIAGLAFFSQRESSTTGYYVIGTDLAKQKPPVFLTVELQNTTLLVGGLNVELQVLNFSTLNGGYFSIYGIPRDSFLVVLYPISQNAETYVGKVLYKQSYSPAFTSTFVTGGSRTGTYTDFSHVITYSASPRSPARLSSANISITGFSNRRIFNSRNKYAKGHFVIQDGKSGNASGYWNVSFSYYYDYDRYNTELTALAGRYDAAVSNIYRSRVLSYVFDEDGQKTTYVVGGGFKSPAQVKVDSLTQTKLSLVEETEVGVTGFQWNCTSNRGISTIVYGGGTPYTLLVDKCQSSAGASSPFTEYKATCRNGLPAYETRACLKCDSLGRSCAQYK